MPSPVRSLRPQSRPGASRPDARLARDLSITQLFARQVTRDPDAPALSFGAQSLSYRELDRRSDLVAQQLTALGVVAEERVAVGIPRSPELLIALLAVLKAGGAYLPFDPGHPRERIRFMLEDAGARVLLTTRKTGDLPAEGRRVLYVDELLIGERTRRAHDEPSGERSLLADEERGELAYVCYTSGSTGTPKGVEVTHAGVLRLVHEVGYVALGPEAAVLHAAPAAFDATTFEVWGPLLSGGRCVLYPDAVPTARGLREVITRDGVTTAFLTTALVNAVVDEDPTALAGLTQLLFGGEAVSVGHIARLQAACPALQLVHVYGPTETTTFATAYPIRERVDPSLSTLPIGRAIEGTTIHVLDEQLVPVPVGNTAELFIGGPGVARGYLGRPELTDSRFVRAPDGERLYRTGDLVRALPSGDLIFVGRVDHQVKIRGHRIELGEIESKLSAVEGVSECVVLCREDRPGDKRLVAYCVPRAGLELSPRALRASLSAVLPDYMVPRAYVRLERFPLNANGKIDRGALRKPTVADVDARTAKPPQGPVQEELAGLWANLLDLPEVGADDDFFALGGHSLLLSRLSARIRDAFAVEVALSTLFARPTVEATAPLIEAVLYLRTAPSLPRDRTIEEVAI